MMLGSKWFGRSQFDKRILEHRRLGPRTDEFYRASFEVSKQKY